MLRDSIIVVAVVRTHPRAISLATITMGKFIHGFLFLSYMSMGLRLADLRARRSSAIKQIDSMLPCVCSVIDHRRRQNVVRTSVTHSAIASCATFLFLPHFDVICDLLLNRRTATWNLFVKFSTDGHYAYGLIVSLRTLSRHVIELNQ